MVAKTGLLSEHFSI